MTTAFCLMILGSTAASSTEITQPPSGAAQQQQAEAAARASVQGFHGVLLQAMQLQGGFSERLALLEPAVREFLDIPAIARICLGRSWRNLSEQDRLSFIDALAEVVSATYADRFSGFSGQRFETIEALSTSGGVVVKTQLLRPSDDAVRLDYFFRRGKAFNVVANGVSDLSLRRADYNAILKSKGFGALLAHLQEQRANSGEKS